MFVFRAILLASAATGLLAHAQAPAPTPVMTPGKDRIAIVIDDEAISAPTVNSVPLGGSFVIDGLDEPGEAAQLASYFTRHISFKIIQSRPLPQPANP